MIAKLLCMKYLFFNLGISIFLVFLNLELIAENIKTSTSDKNNHLENKVNKNEILWYRIKNHENNKIKSDNFKWRKFEINKDLKNKSNSIKWLPITQEEIIKDWEIENKSSNSLKNLKVFITGYEQEPLQINPYIQINNFPRSNFLYNSFAMKSSFNGGEARGTGNQNYSYRLDYGLNPKTFISAYISEADDPYFYPIKNIGDQPTKNYWRNYALNFNRKIDLKDLDKYKLSINSSIELWELSTVYKSNNLGISRYSTTQLIGSISSPFTYKLRENANVTLSPRISFLPSKIGANQKGNNFYGNNFSLGIGTDLKVSKYLYFLSSYSFQFGPGHNTFNQNLEFSRNNIYSLGFKWNPSPKFDLRASITNSFGETPATGYLTIPSGNETLYKLNLKLNQNYPDNKQRTLNSREISLLHNGHTINNAILPSEGTNQIFIDIDNHGNYFGTYAYSFSNLLQIEVLNIGSYQKSNLFKEDEFKTLRNTFMGQNNFNNRFGTKLNFLSPMKGDSFWFSNRLTLGREQTKNQGYLFNEFLSTFEINPKLALNINPKLTWSGIKTITGIGIGLNYALVEKAQIIPEYNYIFSESNNSNGSLIIRYLPNEYRSIDLYLSNSEGSQDLGQMLNSKDLRIGIKLNYLF